MRRFQHGFSLVEIMVALAMGMMSMVVVMQVFSVFEGTKRTTTSGADAQTNGAIALYMIERDMKMSGWGMDATVYTSCGTTYSYCDGSASCGGAVGPLADLTTASVIISDGGANPDTITAQYFTDPTEASYSFPGATTLRGNMTTPADKLSVSSLSGCKEGNLMLVRQGNNCTLMKVTPSTLAEKEAAQLRHDETPAGEYNPPASYMTANDWPIYTSSTPAATVACFTAAANRPFFQRSYSIDANRNLMRAGEVVASEIVDLQAQYGVAPVGSQDVNEWVAATGATWANPSATDRKRIKAVRIALVARSTQYEKPADGVCKTTTPAMVTAWSSWASFNTTNYPADWQCYRYKAFETVVPLRNIIMSKI